MRHHAFAIEAPAEVGVAAALAWVGRELGLKPEGNPDIVILHYSLLGVGEARGLAEIAAQAPIVGKEKVIIVAASRAYREAQNALLKLFEEPPVETYLFLVLPSLGGLLPTLRSRVHVLRGNVGDRTAHIPDAAADFIRAAREKRSAIIKKLAAGRDEEERREHRDEAIAIVNGIEAALCQKSIERHAELLRELAQLRRYLHERAAPVRMILEHVAIVLPKDLAQSLV